MIENNPSNVSAAFEMLLEEVEAEIDQHGGWPGAFVTAKDEDGGKRV
jgi:hypothetical protein